MRTHSPLAPRQGSVGPNASAPRASQPERRRRSLIHRLRGAAWAYTFIAPAFLVYAVFVLYPLTQTAWVSLFDWNGITLAEWVGLRNYRDALSDPEIYRALWHSVVFVVFYAVLPTVVGLVLAGVFARIQVRGMTFFRAVLFVPQVLATVVVAVSWRWIYALDGPLNAALGLVGLDTVTRAWLGDFTFALPAIGLIGTWVMYGLCMVLFIAGVQKIPQEIYEAARIDGAGPVREFMSVTLPALRGEIMVALIFTVTLALRNFDIVWNTTTGGPGNTTTVPSIYIYQGAFITRDVGNAAAISVLLTLLILVITAVTTAIFRPREDA